MKPKLSETHLAAINRQRRIVVNFDVSYAINTFFEAYPDLSEFVAHLFTFVDAEDSGIDSIWWNWCEGNQAPYPSQFLPLFDHPLYRQWVEEGTDMVRIILEATHESGLEAFYSHRMNGSDNDMGPFAKIPMKMQHPDWMFRTPWCTHEHTGYWNFAIPEVHAYVLRNLREVAENYDFDGIELDFARGVVFPAGEQWEHRDRLTEFMRKVRLLLLEIEEQRGRPFLLATRVPQDVVGCHFDGLNVETWAREQLVDLFVLGCRSFDVGLYAFRRMIAGTPIKLYSALDDHHASDGYHNPGIEVFRGVAANWWRQGADGIQTFNFNYAPDVPYKGEDWQTHLQAYREIGSPKTLRRKGKVFIVQRRGGGHGPSVIPNPEDWSTPRHWYGNSNMMAQLPVPLANDGKADTLITLFVGDDLSADVAHIGSVSLRVLLNDPATRELPDEEKIERAVIRKARPTALLHNSPPVRGIEERIEVRLNNAPLGKASVEGGWLVFDNVWPKLFAVGDNLIGLRLTERVPASSDTILIEKLEVHVAYR